MEVEEWMMYGFALGEGSVAYNAIYVHCYVACVVIEVLEVVS